MADLPTKHLRALAFKNKVSVTDIDTSSLPPGRGFESNGTGGARESDNRATHLRINMTAGVVADGRRFVTWAALMAAIAELGGAPVVVSVEGTDPIVVPDGSYDLTGVTFVRERSAGSIQITSEDADISGGLRMRGPVQWSHSHATTNLLTAIAASNTNVVTDLQDGASIEAAGAAPVILVETGATHTLVLGHGAAVQTAGPGEVAECEGTGTLTIELHGGLTGSSQFEANCITGAAGSSLNIVQFKSGLFTVEQTDFVGTITLSRSERGALNKEVGASFSAAGPTAMPVHECVNRLIRMNTTANNVSISLPPANTPGIAGVPVMFKRIAGANDAIVVPDGSDTIDGAADYTLVVGKNFAATLMSDGVSNWMIVG